MSGSQLRRFVWSILALLGVTYLTFFGKEPSWSQNAMTALHFLLNFSLLAIADVFGEIAAYHPDKDEAFYKWFAIDVRLKHLANFTKYSFYAILVFHLGHEYLPEILHMVVTGCGVAGLYLIMIRHYDTWSNLWWWNMIMIHTAVVMLILAFGFKIGLVKNGEYALALAGLVHIFLTNKKS